MPVRETGREETPALLPKEVLLPDMFSLKGRVALVTGASRGLGFAMARALAENGAKVIVNARDPAALAEAAQKIGVKPWLSM